MKTHILLILLFNTLLRIRFILKKALTHFGTTHLCLKFPCQAFDLFSVYHSNLVLSKAVCTDIYCCKWCTWEEVAADSDNATLESTAATDVKISNFVQGKTKAALNPLFSYFSQVYTDCHLVYQWYPEHCKK